MIVTITINPAVDKSTTLDKLVPEKKLRCEKPLIEAGGGGINVSKALHELGGDSLALFPAGGTNGTILQELLAGSGIRYTAIPVASNTRENVMVTERATNTQYRFVMPGGELTGDELEKVLAAVKELQPAPAIIVASGSLPPGAPDDCYARLAHISREMGARFIADTSGPSLQLMAKEGLYLLKANLSELCSLVGKDFLQLDEVYAAAKQVLDNGYCEVLVVSMGPSGALLITRDQHITVPAPVVKKLSTVGAGDSMVAGMVWMLEQGGSMADMLRFGVACGTAATMSAGTQLFRKEDVYRLYEWLKTV
ncbi:1-phosphofructokinase family hexose kinase [Chitinophaga japonensis]|uniref:6-phosphofructokinase 2 n=1 Tax=Chitinophaga japonensis TaxID=104662 RepID=A0A562SSC1_CHIJA|nr:1-phosphofructokinase family hexose kinase [Chitinophaga japonensis]TWI84112.1 6-phosphofructokinase 2 [Chitinophaga japonensis]